MVCTRCKLFKANEDNKVSWILLHSLCGEPEVDKVFIVTLRVVRHMIRKYAINTVMIAHLCTNRETIQVNNLLHMHQSLRVCIKRVVLKSA